MREDKEVDHYGLTTVRDVDHGEVWPSLLQPFLLSTGMIEGEYP